MTNNWQHTNFVTMACHANNAANDGRCRILDSSKPSGYWSDADVVRVGGTGSSQCKGSGGGMCGDPDLGSPNNQCSPGKCANVHANAMQV